MKAACTYKPFFLYLAFFTLSVLAFVPVSRADTLFGVTFGPNNLTSKLIAIDTATGAGTLVGILDNSIPADIAARGAKLFIYDQVSNLLKEVDPFTAETINAINLGTSITGEGGMTFRGDGLGFLSNGGPGSSTRLFSFDVTTHNASPITPIGGLTPSMDGLAVSPSGILFGLTQDFAALYTIDQASGVTSSVGSLGVQKTLGLGGLTFRSDGTLFGVIDDHLYTINTATGIANLVGSIGFDDISGIAFLGTSLCARAADTACLQNGRFEVKVTWNNNDGSGSGKIMNFGGQRIENIESAFYYFQAPTNFEMGVKVLNACIPAFGNKFWVFVSGLTDQGWQLTVRDLRNGETKTYSNTRGHLSSTFADTAAFNCQ